MYNNDVQNRINFRSRKSRKMTRYLAASMKYRKLVAIKQTITSSKLLLS